MSEPVLDASELRKTFGGVKAVDRVSFSVAAGEMVALIGPNGAGKTTCFNMLNGQLAPDHGTVHIGGTATTGLSPAALWRLGVGRTFQIAATFASMTVRENVRTALLSKAGALGRPWARTTGDLDEAADRLCAVAGLSGVLDRMSGELAYGAVKRIELAIALANAPRLLLMDEPTAGMSPGDRIALMRTVADLARERGIAVLFTEHDMDVVFAHASRILVLDRGRVIASGSPADIRQDERVRAVYLGEGLTFGFDEPSRA